MRWDADQRLRRYARILVPTQWNFVPSVDPATITPVAAGELARAIGLPVPDLVGVEVDPGLGDAEPDEEIHDLVAPFCELIGLGSVVSSWVGLATFLVLTIGVLWWVIGRARRSSSDPGLPH